MLRDKARVVEIAAAQTSHKQITGINQLNLIVKKL